MKSAKFKDTRTDDYQGCLCHDLIRSGLGNTTVFTSVEELHILYEQTASIDARSLQRQCTQ